MPGNHDRFRDRFGITEPNGGAFDFVFQNHWPTRNRLNYKILDERLGIVLVDFSLLYTNLRNCGLGEVDRATLEELRQLTFDLKNNYRGLAIMWVVHFAPDCDNHSVDKDLRLLASDLLLEAAVECEISTIICGHTHKHKSYSHKDVDLFCAGSALYYPEKNQNGNWFHVVEIDTTDCRAKLIGKRNYRKEKTQRSFKELDTKAERVGSEA